MKIVAIGVGQCGCNIADEFYAINNYSKSFFGRRIEIVTDVFAINTDETDLSSLRHIPPRYEPQDCDWDEQDVWSWGWEDQC